MEFNDLILGKKKNKSLKNKKGWYIFNEKISDSVEFWPKILKI